MHFQDPSLLQLQKRLEKKHHKRNLQTRFAVKSIPVATQLRTMIDEVNTGPAEQPPKVFVLLKTHLNKQLTESNMIDLKYITTITHRVRSRVTY